MSTITTDDVMNLKVTALKAQLTQRDLSTKGVKAVLQKRLIDFLNTEASAGDATTGMEVDEATTEATNGATGADSAVRKSEIDESTRYQGKVLNFNPRRGFGYIIPDGKEEADKIFVHWKQIQSDDKWPQLDEGTVVEYYLGKMTGGPKRKIGKLFAATVSLPGGEKISAVVAANKSYPDREARFTGKVKFYDKKKGFGFIELTEDASSGDIVKSSGDQIYVAREDIELPNDPDYGAPVLKKDLEVEFTMYRDDNASEDKEKIGAGDVTGPGSVPIELSAEERKISRQQRRYPGVPERDLIHNKNIRGEVLSFRGKFGFLKATTYDLTQDGLEKNKIFAHKDDIVRGDRLEKGMRVEFNVYKDEKGYGATNIRIKGGGGGGGVRLGKRQFGRQDTTIGQIVQVQLPNGQIQMMRVAGQMGGGMPTQVPTMGGGRRSKRQRREGGGRDGGFSFSANSGRRGERASLNVGLGEIAIDLEVEKTYIGGIIGKSGAVIKDLRRQTGCEFDISKEPTGVGSGNNRTVRVTGDKIAVAKGLVSLAKNIADQAQSLHWKLTILLPDSLCGRIIGKGGATIKKLRGDTSVNIKIAKQAMDYPGLGSIAPCVIFGGQQDVAGVLGRIVDILATSRETTGGHGHQYVAAQPMQIPMMGGFMPQMMRQQMAAPVQATYRSRPATTFATAPSFASPIQMMQPQMMMPQMFGQTQFVAVPQQRQRRSGGGNRQRRSGRATTGYGTGGVY